MCWNYSAEVRVCPQPFDYPARPISFCCLRPWLIERCQRWPAGVCPGQHWVGRSREPFDTGRLRRSLVRRFAALAACHPVQFAAPVTATRHLDRKSPRRLSHRCGSRIFRKSSIAFASMALVCRHGLPGRTHHLLDLFCRGSREPDGGAIELGVRDCRCTPARQHCNDTARHRHGLDVSDQPALSWHEPQGCQFHGLRRLNRPRNLSDHGGDKLDAFSLPPLPAAPVDAPPIETWPR